MKVRASLKKRTPEILSINNVKDNLLFLQKK